MTGSTATPRGQLKSPVLVKPRWPQTPSRCAGGVKTATRWFTVSIATRSPRASKEIPRTWLKTEVLVSPGGTIGLGIVWAYVYCSTPPE